MVHQVRQHTELVTRQLDGNIVACNPGEPRIERDGAATDSRLQLPTRTPDERTESGEHLLHPEGLRQVIVRALVDALNGLVPAPAGGQDQNRNRQTGAAPAAEYRQTIDSRESQVENHDVIGLGSPEEIGALAVARAVDGVAGIGQRTRQLPREQHFVLDDQDSHELIGC